MKKLIAMMLCAAMLLSMAGCKQPPVETTAPPTTVPAEPTATDLYAEARAELESAGHISLELILTKYTTVAGDEFSEQSSQTLTYQGIGTEDLIIAMDEKVDFSIHVQ